jgi:hypothetical protein
MRATLMQGGLLDTIPPQAAFMIFGLPSELYVPMMSTGEGSKIDFAGSESFMMNRISSNYQYLPLRILKIFFNSISLSFPVL